MCHLCISHTSVHLPGGTVQQGYKCDGSLRASISVKVTYTHTLWGRLRLSIHWACYWYGKLGQSNPILLTRLEKSNVLRALDFGLRVLLES